MTSDAAAPAVIAWPSVPPRDLLDLAADDLTLNAAESRYAAAARAPSTLRGYRTDWQDWCSWCEQHDCPPLPAPAAQLARFIAHLADAGAKPGTVGRKLSAVRYAHKLCGLDDPTASARVATVWEGIRRSIAREGGRQAHVDQAPPLMPPRLWDVLDACPTTTTWTTRENEPSLAGARDRALLLMGFFGALRRSEIARVKVDYLHRDARGYVIELPWSKTNQYGTHADLIALPRLTNPDRCPVTAIETWLALADIGTGPLLRKVTKGNRPGATALSEDGVNRIVVGAVARARITPTGTPISTDPVSDDQPNRLRAEVPYSAHSLRAGFVTYAHSRGATASQIAHQTRHTSLASVRTYTRLASVWDDNAVTALGL